MTEQCIYQNNHLDIKKKKTKQYIIKMHEFVLNSNNEYCLMEIFSNVRLKNVSILKVKLIKM